MKMENRSRAYITVLAGALVSIFLFVGRANAHCDTLDGPVVKDARAALEKGEVTPVLKWVKSEHEKEVKEVFGKALAAKNKEPKAREKAEMNLFETLVRLHRAGEGAPYTGLKPAGEVEPIVQASDQALETGSVDALVKQVSEAVEKGIRARFQEAKEKKVHVDESVKDGREFVEAYVTFVHYVEGIQQTAEGAMAEHHAEHETKKSPDQGHGHSH
ncbi:MAG: DUF6448 family protein [bacterium]|nr:DUF6448 family protein [bacterium]